MKNYVIIKISIIAKKELVLIQVKGYKQAVIRTTNQFLREMKSSNIIPEGVNSMTNPLVLQALRGLTGGTVFGEMSWYDKGTEYIIEDGHPALSEPSHTLYGEVGEGDSVARETAGFYIERGNMLSLIPNGAYETNQAIAAAASYASDIADLFATPSTSTSSEETVEDGEDDAQIAPIVDEPTVEEAAVEKPTKKVDKKETVKA